MGFGEAPGGFSPATEPVEWRRPIVSSRIVSQVFPKVKGNFPEIYQEIIPTEDFSTVGAYTKNYRLYHRQSRLLRHSCRCEQQVPGDSSGNRHAGYPRGKCLPDHGRILLPGSVRLNAQGDDRIGHPLFL